MSSANSWLQRHLLAQALQAFDQAALQGRLIRAGQIANAEFVV